MPPKRAKKAAPVKPALDGCKLVLSGTFPGQSQASLKAKVEGAGAVVASAVTEDTTHVVATVSDYSKPSTKVSKALANGIPIVSLEWLDLCAENNVREAEKDFVPGVSKDKEDDDQVAPPAATKSVPAPAVTSQTTVATLPTRASRKRAAPQVADTPAADDDAAPPKPKKTRARKAVKVEEDVMEDDLESEPEPKPKAKPEPVIGQGQVAKKKDIQIPLDEGCPYVTSVVYIDDSGVIFDASLNQTNSSSNNNKFYRIQLLMDSNNTYRTWTRWGRVGERGQTAVAGQGSLPVAMKQFEKKFKDKSGLSWDQRGENPKPGKYAFVERNYSADSDEEEEEDEEKKDTKGKKVSDWQPPKCTLHPAVQKFLQLIFNQRFFAETMSALNYDVNKLPLGKLSKATITRGFQALKDLSALIDDQSLAMSKYSCSFPTAVENLSNSFYSLIPHAFGRNRPPIMQDQQMLKREIELLESLSDMKDAALIMKLDKVGNDDVHPLDKQYEGLKLNEMTPLDPSTAEYTNLKDYLVETRGYTHGVNYDVEAIFRIQREGEKERFDSSPFGKIGQNRRLLWHGSRSTNFGGILSQGLRIAPPEAPVSGYMFGKGIYLADMSSKSAGYCFSSSSGGNALLLLCEAELGDPMQNLVHASYNAGEDAKAKGMIATFGQGTTGPSKWKDAECVHPSLEGVKMPDPSTPPGDTDVRNSSLYYNEYIAYDVAQVRLRYLFHVKMR
ncbi:poly-ribose polymerase-like protein [Bombardia bombarda]|uniref:Poly [ADP-ribose] polymerase n=1 Tax=Bombardia bombarda TaxID=252184 RepID=A0AA39W9K8_9PEZI|nr:poly-ribose polymerase-like protein [Bombardia bombarda]